MSPERMSIIEQIEKNKKILRAEYQKGYIAGSEKTKQELIEEFLEFLRFKSGSLEGFDSLTVFNKKDFEEEYKKWEQRKE